MIGMSWFFSLMFLIALISGLVLPLRAEPFLIATHIPSKNPRALWQQMVKKRAPDIPRSCRCENGDVVQLMVTKVDHGQGNLLVSYINLSGQTHEGLCFSGGTYSSFRKGIHAGDFYGRDSAGLLGFDSWIHAGQSSW